MQGLNEYQPVKPVDEIYGCLDQARFHEEEIHRSELAQKDDECKDAGIGGQDYRQKGQGGEDSLSPLSVSRQNVRQGQPEHGGGQEHQCTQVQGISKGFKVIGVFEKP